MRILNANLLAVALLPLMCMDALAEWQLNISVDAITDKERKTAEVYNVSGYKFAIYRADDGRVYGLFALPESLVETISPRSPLYLRVDKHKAQEIAADNPLASLGITTYFWEPGFVNFLLWHGKQEEGIAPVIDQFMSGANLLIRYPIGTGGTRDVSFTLEGANDAIVKALDLSDDPAVQAKAREAEAYKSVVTSYMDGCTKLRNPAQAIACTNKYLNCSEQFSSPEWQGLDQCLKR